MPTGLDSFLPQGNTTIIASTAASATAAQQFTGGIQGARLVNLSTVDAYLAFGASTATAAAPSTAGAASFPLMQRTEKVISLPPNFWVSAITTAGQANIALTPGIGQ